MSFWNQIFGWNQLLGLFSTDLAIDLGTANTLVFVRDKGVILNEPSVVAIIKTNGAPQKILAVGREAKEMLGKTPGNIVAIRPMRDGVIADFTVTEAMLKYFISKVNNRKYLVKSRIVISVPAGITDVERKAVREAAEGAGVREVYLIEQPMAAAIGAGLSVQDPRGCMIVDIGGGTTDVAVISLGGIVNYVTLKVAGDKMDEAIIQYVRRRHNILVGERTAEMIKITIGSAYPLAEEKMMAIKGRDLISGVPRMLQISSQDIRDALSEVVRAIIEAVKATLEKTPPELAGDIFQRGLVLAGGGGQLAGLDEVLREEVGIPISVGNQPLLSVVHGVGMVLENLDRYRNLLI